MRRIIALSVLFLVSAVAQAADGWYAGASFVQVDYKETGFETVSPTAVAFRLGREINPYLAVEGRLGTGLSEDTIRVAGVNVSVEVDNFIGVYARGMIPTGTLFRPYGMVGYTSGELTASGGGVAVSADESDFSYGLGADFNIGKQLVLNAEFARLFKGAGFKVEGFSLGVAFRF